MYTCVSVGFDDADLVLFPVLRFCASVNPLWLFLLFRADTMRCDYGNGRIPTSTSARIRTQTRNGRGYTTVEAIIFLAPLAFNQTLEEDPTVNRLVSVFYS